ncbi:MAG: type II secretion system GspH family protein [Deltaproteobacteria bacterium]|jgi:prepilin-type N-terminal cleavage/methylation domain-containing protein|nr:type II secretion system GspH family protein [Deltaproteobacteria bacterium]
MTGTVKMFAKSSARSGFTLLELLVVSAIIGTLVSVAIPRYAQYRRAAADRVSLAAGYAIQTCEELFFATTGHYTEDYASLGRIGGLVRDPNIMYGQISLYVISANGIPAYKFSVRNKAEASHVYLYDSSGSYENILTTDTGLDVSVW